MHGLTRLRMLTETLLVGMVARTNCGMMLAQADKLKATELRKAAMQVRHAVVQARSELRCVCVCAGVDGPRAGVRARMGCR